MILDIEHLSNFFYHQNIVNNMSFPGHGNENHISGKPAILRTAYRRNCQRISPREEFSQAVKRIHKKLSKIARTLVKFRFICSFVRCGSTKTTALILKLFVNFHTGRLGWIYHNIKKHKVLMRSQLQKHISLSHAHHRLNYSVLINNYYSRNTDRQKCTNA